MLPIKVETRNLHVFDLEHQTMATKTFTHAVVIESDDCKQERKRERKNQPDSSSRGIPGEQREHRADEEYCSSCTPVFSTQRVEPFATMRQPRNGALQGRQAV